MNPATLKQAGKVMKMIGDKETSEEHLQWMFKTGALSDLLDASPDAFDREAYRKVLGLKPLVSRPGSLLPVVAGGGEARIAEIMAPRPFTSHGITVDTDVFLEPPHLALRGAGTEHVMSGPILLEKLGDKLYANDSEVVRHLSLLQKSGTMVCGHLLRKELKGMQVLNACVLEALLAHPELIPDGWKVGRTYFWGTVLMNGDVKLAVAYLVWEEKAGWIKYYDLLDSSWRQNDYAAVVDLLRAA
jgi:hypothetical protein